MPTPGSTEVAGPMGAADVGTQAGGRGTFPQAGDGRVGAGPGAEGGEMNKGFQAGGRGQFASTGSGRAGTGPGDGGGTSNVGGGGPTNSGPEYPQGAQQRRSG